MKKFALELSESELKVVINALKYTKAYKGQEVYETVLRRVLDQLEEGVSRYYVVQGWMDDGICRYSKAVLVKARSQKHAVCVAMSCLESTAGETFIPVVVGEATKNYGLCEVL